ncbi:MAG: hypothetical protein ACI4QV_01980 [Acutalibacteraceae bacterium]
MKNVTKTVFVFLFSMIAAALRVFQLLNTVDPATGNVLNRYIPIQIYFDIAALVLLAAVIALGAFSKPHKQGLDSKSTAMGIGSVIMSAGCIYDAFYTLWGILSDFSSLDISSLILFVLTAVSALYFVSFAYSMFVKKSENPSAWLPAIVILQQTAKLVLSYISGVKNANLAEHKFDILIAAAFVMFWVFYARFINKNMKLRRLAGAFSASAVFCGAYVLIPRITAYLLPKIIPSVYPQSSAVFSSSPFSAQDAATIIFAVIFIFYINMESSKKELTPEPLAYSDGNSDDGDFEEDDFFKGIHAISGKRDSNNDQMMRTIFGEPEALSGTKKEQEKPVRQPFKIRFEDEIPHEESSDGGIITESNASEAPSEKEDGFKASGETEQSDTADAFETESDSKEGQMSEKSSADEIIDNLLDEILGKYKEDEK